MRLVLYTGKGGVGKTTTAAAAAAVAAERGVRTLVASADAAHSLGDVLDLRLGAEPREVAPRLAAVEIDARVESARHWGRIQRFLAKLFVHQGIEEAVAEELALVPGAEELTTLLAVERIARGDAFDLLVLDCAPTDAALRLVTLPDVARGMVRTALHVAGALAGVTTPLARRILSAPLPDADVFEEAEALLYLELAALHARLTGADTSARLVLTPERMVIDEARRAYTELSLFEIGCDAVVMNRLLPGAAAEEPFFRDWGRIQETLHAEVEESFAPLPVLRAPLQPDEVIGLPRLVEHGRELFADASPEGLLCPAQRVRFEREDGVYWVRLPLPGADAASLDVAMVDDDLVVSTRARRRSLRLPRRFSGLHLAGARLDAGTLHVRLARAATPARGGGA